MTTWRHRWVRPLRRGAHRILGLARGGAVSVSAAPGWKLRLHREAYEEMRYWLRYETGTFAALRGLWQPGLRVLDIGAHHGEFSLACLPVGRPGVRLLSVEPSPAARRLMRKSRDLHPQADWRIAATALGETEGELDLHPGDEQMLVIGRGGEDPSAAVSVPLTTTDRFCERYDFWPQLVKLDVEGYEYEVLRGAAGALSHKPCILLEWHCAMLRQRGMDPAAALAPLLAAGYLFQVCDTPALEPPCGGAALVALPAQDSFRLLCLPPP